MQKPPIKRRAFLRSAALAGVAVFTSPTFAYCLDTKTRDYSVLDKVLQQAVLKKDLFKEPVILYRVELLRYENNFICQVITKEGAIGYAVSNNAQMLSLYPIFINRLQPFFKGKDARNLEQLLEEVYVYKSNYKLQNLALWVPLATIEFAILDVLGKLAGLPVGQLIGDIHHPSIGVYRANNYRGETPRILSKKFSKM